MQKLATVYTERFRLDCVHADCGCSIIVMVERVKGETEMTVTLQHETDRLTETNQRESVGNGSSRFRQ